jgi:hypothetical protein
VTELERRYELAEMEAIHQAFFLLWTRREAAAKALGLDLIASFDRLSLPPVSPSPAGFRVELPGSTGGPDGSGSWWLRAFVLLPGRGGEALLMAVLLDERMNLV